MKVFFDLVTSLGAAALGAIIVGAFWRFRSRLVEWWAGRRFDRSFRAGKTCVVESLSWRANWDREAGSWCRMRLDESGINHREVFVDDLGELWEELAIERLVNLIIFGSPMRLPLAVDFLDKLGSMGSLPRSLWFVTSDEINGGSYLRTLGELDGYHPSPVESNRLHPVHVPLKREGPSGKSLIWPGIVVETDEKEILFPKYPCEGDVRPVTFRGCEHGIILVCHGTIMMPGQPDQLRIQRLVMLMGYSGPSTLASTITYLTRPDLFEPKRGGVLLSVLEVPVVCDTPSDDEDLRFVPANSVRIVHRWNRFAEPVREISLPRTLGHSRLWLEQFRKSKRAQGSNS